MRASRFGNEKALFFNLLSFEWNSIRLSGPAHGIVTKTVHKTLPGGGQGGRVMGVRGEGGGRVRVVGVKGVGVVGSRGRGGGVKGVGVVG